MRFVRQTSGVFLIGRVAYCSYAPPTPRIAAAPTSPPGKHKEPTSRTPTTSALLFAAVRRVLFRFGVGLVLLRLAGCELATQPTSGVCPSGLPAWVLLAYSERSTGPRWSALLADGGPVDRRHIDFGAALAGRAHDVDRLANVCGKRAIGSPEPLRPGRQRPRLSGYRDGVLRPPLSILGSADLARSRECDLGAFLGVLVSAFFCWPGGTGGGDGSAAATVPTVAKPATTAKSRLARRDLDRIPRILRLRPCTAPFLVRIVTTTLARSLERCFVRQWRRDPPAPP